MRDSSHRHPDKEENDPGFSTKSFVKDFIGKSRGLGEGKVLLQQLPKKLLLQQYVSFPTVAVL